MENWRWWWLRERNADMRNPQTVSPETAAAQVKQAATTSGTFIEISGKGIRLIIYALPFLMECRQLLCHCHHHRNHDQDHHHLGHQHHHYHAGVQEWENRRLKGCLAMDIIIVIFTIIITLKIITIMLVFRNEKIGDSKATLQSLSLPSPTTMASNHHHAWSS